MAKTKETEQKKAKPLPGGSSHKGQKLQNWKEKQMDKAFELWESNPAREAQGLKALSLREIGRMVGIGKTTVTERIKERRKGRGHIAGGRRQARVLTEGKNFGYVQAGRRYIFKRANNRT